MATRLQRMLRNLAGIAALLAAGSAFAVPITYVHTGSGSGTLGDHHFGDLAPVAFTINALGDTANVQSCGGGCLYNDNTSASITISGLGTFDFITPTRYFSNVGVVGFSRADSGGLDLFDGPADPVGWDMVSSKGPIAGTGTLLQWSLPPVDTSGGVLVFMDGNSDSTFQAAVVPEPSTVALLLGALPLVALATRRGRTRRD